MLRALTFLDNDDLVKLTMNITEYSILKDSLSVLVLKAETCSSLGPEICGLLTTTRFLYKDCSKRWHE